MTREAAFFDQPVQGISCHITLHSCLEWYDYCMGKERSLTSLRVTLDPARCMSTVALARPRNLARMLLKRKDLLA